MSNWLADRTGIHIGSGAKKIDTTKPPPEIANNPQALADWLKVTNQVNGTIDNGNKWSHIAEAAVPVALGGAAVLGLGGFGSAAAGAADAGAAGTAAAGTAAGTAAASGGIESVLGSIPGGAQIYALYKAGKVALSDVLDFAKNNGGSLVEAANVADAAWRQKQANDYAKQALKSSQDAYDAKAPLRTAGIAGMQFSANHGNPFAAGYNKPSAPSASPLPVASPAVLGQPATGAQASQAFTNIQNVLNSGPVNPRSLLGAAQGATALPMAGMPAPAGLPPGTPGAPGAPAGLPIARPITRAPIQPLDRGGMMPTQGLQVAQ